MILTMPFDFENFENQDYDTDKIINENFFNTDLILNENQNELLEKFNSAFVEAQNGSKSYTEIYENFESESPNENTNFLLDILLNKDETFDIQEAQNFGFVLDNEEAENVFYVPPPFKPFSGENTENTYENFEDLGLSDIDFCDNLSSSSFDIDTITTELCENENYEFDYNNTCLETEKRPEKLENQFILPSVTTFGQQFTKKKYLELDNFIRNSPADCINIFAQVRVIYND